MPSKSATQRTKDDTNSKNGSHKLDKKTTAILDKAMFARPEAVYTRVGTVQNEEDEFQDDEDSDGILRPTMQSYKSNFDCINCLKNYLLFGLLIAVFFLLKELIAQQPAAASLDASISPTLPKFKKPIFIVSAGLARTGSTGLYNILRHWVTLVDPNAVYGWKFGPDEIDEIVEGGATLLVKFHHPYKFDSSPDIVFMSHRRPSDTHCSLKMMDFDKGEKTCEHFLNVQDNLYNWADEVGAKKVYDMDFRDWIARPLDVIREMGELMDISPIRDQDIAWIFDHVSNTKAFKFATDLVPSHHPVTLMHAHHKNSNSLRAEMCSKIQDWVDQYCPAWEQREGAYIRPKGPRKKVRYAKWRPNYLAPGASSDVEENKEWRNTVHEKIKGKL